MIKNQREYSRSPQHIGQTIIKSQKNISISAAFHMKTENDKGQDQHHRSPDVARTDMRDTWRRPRMPYNKLPEVFNQQKQKKKYGGKINQDILVNLDKMVENSEYKETQKYLQPLKFKEEDKKKQASQSRNPLNPVKKMIKMMNKARQMQDQSVEQFFSKSGPKISECITLQVIKRSHNTGTVKKMLHVPTLTLLCIRQQPYTLKQSRNAIRDWTQLWTQRLSGENLPFITVHEVIYNFPEGAQSIIMQYFKSRTLLNLLDLTATLPESVIRQIFNQVLKAMQIFYANTNMHFGGISPSQIMFTDGNKIKLSLGLFYHIPNLDSSYNIYYLRVPQKINLFDFNNTLTRFMKSNQKFQTTEVQKSIDIFKIGMCMLQCAIGSFENFEQSSFLFEALKYIFTEQGQRLAEIDNLCCLIHSENYLLKINFINGQNDKSQRKSEDKYISYIKLLKDRFSLHFINFLCNCLKLQHNRRAAFSQISSHTFITTPHDNDNRTVKIDLASMLAIGRGWNQQVYESGTQYKLDSFLQHIKKVFQGCKNKDVLNQLYTLHQDRIYSLGNEVGLNAQTLGSRLEKILSDILKNGK